MSWIEAAHDVLDRFARTQVTAVQEAGRLCAESIASENLVHLFGSGHSRFPVDEMFPRYGSFPGFRPVIEGSLTTYSSVTGPNGLPQSMFLERVEGFGTVIAEQANIEAGDTVMVFSVSGTNHVPRDFASTAKQTGASVIAVTNRASHLPDKPTIADGADVVIDLGVAPGDAVVEIDGWPAPIAPVSTIAYVCAVNEIRVCTARILADRGLKLPVISHPTVVGPEASVAAIAEVCAEHERRIGARRQRPRSG